MGREKILKLGVFDETDQLKKVTVWGLVGIEAELAQLYPLELSLFFTKFNVLKVRKEISHYIKVLENMDIKVMQARDELANILPTQNLSKNEVLTAIFKRVENLKNKYHIVPDKNWKKRFIYLIEKDIDRYGEKKALILNKTLGIDYKLPLGNQFSLAIKRMCCSIKWSAPLWKR